MASVVTQKNGLRYIQYHDASGLRKTIRLGKLNLRSAESVCHYVESLISAQAVGSPPDRATLAWLEGITDEMRKRLANAGLIAAPVRSEMRAFLDEYILSRQDVKPATREIWSQPCRNLVEFFGADRPLQTITAGDASRFAQWLSTQKLAAATVAKRLTFARTFFNVALDHEFIPKNPFARVKGPAADVTARQRFVDRETYRRVMEAANPIWRVIIGLSRMGGLRCPSEVLSLEWRHIDWNRDRITVPSPKTERYEGKASRILPLFPELREILSEAHELAEPGEVYVVGGKTGETYRKAAMRTKGMWMNANLRTTFLKIIRRAGLEPWPRPFHNMRASRETELLEQFPNHVVAAWLGHDVDTQLKHYAQVTAEHFERAAKSAAIALQNALQSMSSQDAVKPCETQLSSCLEETYDDLESSDETYAQQKSGARGI